MLTVEDSFSRYCRVYLIPNKEAHTEAKVLMDHHFNVYKLLNQLHSDNGREFVHNLWRALFSEFKIQHTIHRHISGREMKLLKGGGNCERKTISAWRDANIHPWYLGEHEIQQDSIQRIGMNLNKKKTNDRYQINGRGFRRWCFVAEV